MNSQNTPEYSKCDMATTLQALRNFSGGKEEDTHNWLCQASVTASIYSLDKPSTVKLIYLKLRDEAQRWTSNLISRWLNI